MRSELRRYSSIGNKPGILLLCNNILTQSKATLDSVRASCSFINGVEVNFNCGILAFESLNLISKDNIYCYTNDPFFKTLPKEKAITKLCDIVFSFLIEEGLVNIDLLRFNETANLFYIPRQAFSLHSSVFRNLLISLNAISPVQGEFRIAKEFDLFFDKLILRVKRKLTLAQLQQKLIAEQELGEKGELFVLDFERNRCPFCNDDKSRIRQISHIDVSAGYDIISFHNEIDKKRRYIEVKTFIGNPHFYWSSNEINSAKVRGNDYYLYLVDGEKMFREDYIPEIIQNPYSTILNSHEWKLTPSSFLIEKNVGLNT